jgi:hypothetical protein
MISTHQSVGTCSKCFIKSSCCLKRWKMMIWIAQSGLIQRVRIYTQITTSSNLLSEVLLTEIDQNSVDVFVAIANKTIYTSPRFAYIFYTLAKQLIRSFYKKPVSFYWKSMQWGNTISSIIMNLVFSPNWTDVSKEWEFINFNCINQYRFLVNWENLQKS